MNSTEWTSRTELLIGADKLEKLSSSHILIMGLGGVGSYSAELICRAGIGKMTIVDGDKIEPSNKNRQLPALTSTLGLRKAEVVAARLLDINPELDLTVINNYIPDQEMEELLTSEKFDYVVDAIDTLSPKAHLIFTCVSHGIPVVSSMGAGGKFDPTQVQISDISKSFNCTLARKLRKRMYKLGIKKGFKVVFSPEEIVKESVVIAESRNKKSTVGTISFMPPVFGCHCASVVINSLLAGLQPEMQKSGNAVSDSLPFMPDDNLNSLPV